ncbi:MAG TPA: hypothetical protein PKA16_08040 [Ottowia sp.]|uniref:hypothetical protein n=1 Tax=Ottowia sp. TaxID=1898956 RepID=UPI002BBE6588|nr:hypothetical protein [Ottowia sp.]HMN21329.1 hypothetical protein [Ottowia sp.]
MHWRGSDGRRGVRTVCRPGSWWGLSLLGLASLAPADAPQPPPALHTVCTADRAVCAESDPVAGRTTARDADGRTLWTLPGWHRTLFLAGDGRSAVVAPDGANLVPLDATLARPVLRFFHEGRLLRSVTLGALYEELDALPRSASHRVWAQAIGFDAAGRFVVTLVDGRTASFRPDGQRLGKDGP